MSQFGGKGAPPKAADYQSFIGTSSSNSAYASSAAATNQLAALWGVGYGDRGYGQTSPVLNAISTGGSVLGSDWNAMDTVIANMGSYQGTSTTGLPAAANEARGQVVSGAYNWGTLIPTLDTNRANTNGGASLSVTSGALTITRATTWGGGSTGITAVFTATFATEDAARYFFNTGGAINIVLAHPNTTTTQNTNWNTALSTLGTISIAARAATRSGSGGTLTSLGYWNLTTAYQTILSGAIGTGSYTANTILVQALVSSVAGLNGANGKVVQVTITLTDGHTNSFSDTVASGTNASLGYKKAGAILTIAAPTLATVTNF